MIIGYSCITFLVSACTIWGFFSVYLKTYFYYYRPEVLGSIPNVLNFMTFSIWASYFVIPYFVKTYSAFTNLISNILLKVFFYFMYFYVFKNWMVYICGFIVSYAEHFLIGYVNYTIVCIFPQEKGTISGIAIMMVAVNVLFWSNIMTGYINPDNLKPNEDKVFPLIIADNFISFLKIFSIFNLVVGIIGVYLLRNLD